jgi:ribosomal protein S27AE
MSELKGFCPKCGAGYNSWALANLTKQKCSRCGNELAIWDNGVRISTGYSSGANGTYTTVANYRRKFGGGATIIN